MRNRKLSLSVCVLFALIMTVGVVQAEPATVTIGDSLDFPGFSAGFSGTTSDAGFSQGQFWFNSREDTVTGAWAHLDQMYENGVPTDSFIASFRVNGIVGECAPIKEYRQSISITRGDTTIERSLEVRNEYVWGEEGPVSWYGIGVSGSFLLSPFDLISGDMNYKVYQYEEEEFSLDVSFMGKFLDGVSLPSAPAMGASIMPVPEPATMSLLALGGLALIRRRRMK